MWKSSSVPVLSLGSQTGLLQVLFGIDLQSAILLIPGLLGLVGLIGWIIFLFMPERRASLYFSLGKYQKAAMLYERILKKNPQQLRIYSILANLYCLTKRQDSQALQVYNMVSKLGLPTPFLEQIREIVAADHQRQMVDSEDIKVLETMLNSGESSKTSLPESSGSDKG